jgi:hypothetical protein
MNDVGPGCMSRIWSETHLQYFLIRARRDEMQFWRARTPNGPPETKIQNKHTPEIWSEGKKVLSRVKNVSIHLQ